MSFKRLHYTIFANQTLSRFIKILTLKITNPELIEAVPTPFPVPFDLAAIAAAAAAAAIEGKLKISQIKYQITCKII
jgi:hypothetical protein